MGRGAQRGRPKGGAPAWHGRAPPRKRTKRGRDDQRTDKRGAAATDVQCSGVVRKKKKDQTTKPPQQRGKKNKTLHSKGHTEGARRGGASDNQQGAHRGKKEPDKGGAKKSEMSTKAGEQIGATCAGGKKESFGPAPLGCWHPVGYKHGTRDGTQERTGTRGRGARVGKKCRTMPRQGRTWRSERGHRGEDRSDPCQGHKTVPGWMMNQWAREKCLLAARWGINRGWGTGSRDGGKPGAGAGPET